MTAALEQNGEALQFASRDLQHDIDVVTAAFYNTDPEEVIKHVPAAVRGNRSHVLSFINNLITIDSDWLVLLFAVPSLRDDPDVVRAAVQRNPLNIRLASERWHADCQEGRALNDTVLWRFTPFRSNGHLDTPTWPVCDGPTGNVVDVVQMGTVVVVHERVDHGSDGVWLRVGDDRWTLERETENGAGWVPVYRNVPVTNIPRDYSDYFSHGGGYSDSEYQCYMSTRGRYVEGCVFWSEVSRQQPRMDWVHIPIHLNGYAPTVPWHSCDVCSWCSVTETNLLADEMIVDGSIRYVVAAGSDWARLNAHQ